MPEPTNADRILKPLFAAAVMGAVVALSLIWTGKGIHVSGIFSMLCPTGSQLPAAGATSCSIQVAADRDWMAWMVVGIFAGAALTSFWRTRGMRFETERGNGVGRTKRLVLAAAGGLLVGIGAAVAGGCTSSIGLTGSAVLSVAAFAFLAVFFMGGFAARVVFGKFWHV